MLQKQLELLFWSKVDKSNDCWSWKAGKDKDGYGNFKYKGKQEKAHRVVYILTFGEFDRNLLVLHKCDYPTCVNPNHLYLGTVKDNTMDRVRRGRQDSGGTRLTIEQLEEAKLLHSKGITYRKLAIKYGCSHKTLNNYVLGKIRRYDI